MVDPSLIHSAGLVCDIIGVSLLYLFVVPPVIIPDGKPPIDIQIARYYRNKRRARQGIGMLLFGFVLQFISGLI